MTDQVWIINPIGSPLWDRQILANGKGSFFHSAAWAATLSETYAYTPCYFVLFDGDNKVRAMVPMMEVLSFFTGKRGTSLPFSDHCEPIWETAADLDRLLTSILDYGKRRGWEYLELRSAAMKPDDQPASKKFLGHTLDLSPDENELFRSFRESTRRNIKKAEKSDVTCTVGGSMEAVEQFYALNCLTRKRHGIPPQPFAFFKNLHKHILSRDQGTIILASHQNRVVAGAVYLSFGRRAMYKYGASDPSYQELRANYLVMWHAIRLYREAGFESLDLGRTDPENRGLSQFKKGWNPEAVELVYYRYSLRESLARREGGKSPAMTGRIMQNMPLPILKMIGSVAYRHVG
ncbi:MAG: GNAT family N-acetyltransferase [Desulfurivibrionaceae bacterium]